MLAEDVVTGEEEEVTDLDEEDVVTVVFTRHANSCNNLKDLKHDHLHKDMEPGLSIYGIITALIRSQYIEYTSDVIFVSKLVRTWMTAILLYLPNIPAGKTLNLIVSPFLTEKPKPLPKKIGILAGRVGISKLLPNQEYKVGHDVGNDAIPFDEQIYKILYFIKFLHNFQNKLHIPDTFFKKTIKIHLLYTDTNPVVINLNQEWQTIKYNNILQEEQWTDVSNNNIFLNLDGEMKKGKTVVGEGWNNLYRGGSRETDKCTKLENYITKIIKKMTPPTKFTFTEKVSNLGKFTSLRTRETKNYDISDNEYLEDIKTAINNFKSVDYISQSNALFESQASDLNSLYRDSLETILTAVGKNPQAQTENFKEIKLDLFITTIVPNFIGFKRFICVTHSNAMQNYKNNWAADNLVGDDPILKNLLKVVNGQNMWSMIVTKPTQEGYSDTLTVNEIKLGIPKKYKDLEIDVNKDITSKCENMCEYDFNLGFRSTKSPTDPDPDPETKSTEEDSTGGKRRKRTTLKKVNKKHRKRTTLKKIHKKHRKRTTRKKAPKKYTQKKLKKSNRKRKLTRKNK